MRRFHRVGDDKALNWKEANNNYVFTDIKTTDPIVQIFELEFDSPIQETVGDRTYSIFDSPTYGKLIYEKS
ncbi:hypothetical protein KUH03_39305 [Sphingobacterium sp. E70]|uniref:hypothetical protein n=1 Tax=Sphingobacterium sp. E70 TaxID=2853439 RepID=UPI00211C958A|nr:hypothetical protein [Sphingobacterium sp. E70]ULT24870.1 hypothetical protein KUH03_39305 [Sphingobacterium sp. E70]